MTDKYYKITREASSQIGSHPGLLYLQNLCRSATLVLDVGCGEGTRLDLLLPEKSGIGVDPNIKALTLAVSRYPRHQFLKATGEKLPFPTDNFDLVYSAFAVEHSHNPEKFISEMVRVCRPGGYVVILCPNYGAPSRRSPVSVQNPVTKLILGIIGDIFPESGLNWRSVTPRKIYRHIDDDTTFEPYLLSLVRFLNNFPVVIERQSSLWEIEPQSDKLYKYFFRICKYWGPQIFISARKI